MQHVVRKQTINLALSKKTDAFRIQQLVSGHYWRDVLPLLEDVFDELSDEEEVIQVEQLEIDLGILSEQEINQNRWNNDILAKIKKQLYEKIGSKKKDRSVNRESIALSICRQWLFYMQKGYLPWNTLSINDAWYSNVLEALAIDFASVAELRSVVWSNPVAGRRIVFQHDEHFLLKLTEILTATNQRELPATIEALCQLIFSAVTGHSSATGPGWIELKGKIWEQVLRLAASQQEKSTPALLAERLLTQSLTQHAIGKIIQSGQESLFTPILPVLEKLYGRPELFVKNKEGDITDKQKEGDNIAIKLDKEIDQGGVFVPDAGIVLIHPFLPALFKRLQLVKEGKFIDGPAQQKGLYLLHYLATGAATAEEYELTMPKILCEWPLEMPVEKNKMISETEFDEAGNMLQAVIEQWTVLKNTSVAGLREGFLQRKGKLFTKNDNLYLQVETNTLDVLLDQLPWNLGMIKLPWMKKILRVEWR